MRLELCPRHRPWIQVLASLFLAAVVACSSDVDPARDEDSDPAQDEDEEEDDDTASRKEDAAQRTRDASRPGGDAAVRARDAAAPTGVDAAGLRPRRDGSLPTAPSDAGIRRDAAPAGDGGASADELETLRQLCVDEINMYRETLGVAALARVPEQEACSDEGAKSDGDTGQAHGSAGMCGGLGGQNTCPGWGVGPRTGNASLADALTKCLAQMWAEGEPPVSRQECERDFQGCFLPHGHYLNMSDTRYKRVACGFYQMRNGSWWMNQNFGF